MAIAAIYARSSLGKNRQGETVPHQIAMIQEFAKRMRMNVKFDNKFIYEDDGESGFKTTLLQRPSMRRLINDIENGLIDIVFFKGISRFSRSSGESIITANRLIQRGVRVISLEENYDSDKSDPTMFQIYSVMAEQESRKTAIRVSLGNKQRARNGEWAGSITPYGFIKVKNIKDTEEKKKAYELGLKDNSLYPIENESVVIEQIFNMFVNEKFGRKVIASTLNKKGFRTRKGAMFSDKFVKDMLLNPSVVGDIVYGKTRYEYIDNDEEQRKIQTTIYNDEEEWAICRNAHPPIIDRDTFKKAKQIMNDKNSIYKQPRRFNAAKHPLTGLLKCGSCGAPMICQKRSNKMKDGTKREYRYYVCSTYHKMGRHICSQANVNADKLEDAVFEYVKKKILSHKENNIIISEVKSKNSNKKDLERELIAIQDNIKKKVNASISLLENIGLYDSDTFKEMNVKIKDDIKELRDAEEKVKYKLDQIIDDYDSEELQQFMDEFLKLDVDDIEDKRRKFHGALEEVVIDKNVIKRIKSKLAI